MALPAAIDPTRAPPEHRPRAGLVAAEHGADRGLLERAAEGCHACDLWARATQVVFGEGPVPARLMFVGEQPGDREDRAGKPFVGPAGGIFSKALGAAGIDRETVFVTNVVKHFKWRPAPGSKRRLHERPNKAEVGACLPWVEAELRLVRPEGLVLLGATAAEALLGWGVSVTRDRGQQLESDLAPYVVATVHPSSILRAGPRREAAYDAFVADLRAVAELIA